MGEKPGIPCFRCGICCTRYQVRVCLAEAHELAGRLVATWKEFREKYTDPRWPGTESFLLRHDSGACVFLERQESNQAFCTIHSFRPLSCREWQAGLDVQECWEGLARYWGLGVDESGNFTGMDEAIQRFQAFLGSIHQ